MEDVAIVNEITAIIKLIQAVVIILCFLKTRLPRMVTDEYKTAIKYISQYEKGDKWMQFCIL